MADVVSPEKRSAMMAGIRGRDTSPELSLRKALFARGYRYRLHDRSLPGTPDLVFPRFRAVVFVNGCFWHVHDCHLFRLPASRREFWEAKLNGNRQRDAANLQALQDRGWRTLTVWECALKGKTRLPFDTVVEQAADWLDSGAPCATIEGTRNPARSPDPDGPPESPSRA